ALAAIVSVFGPALRVIPISALRLVVGALLLVFGLQWLRKAILRASGFKALHDEDEIFKREIADVEAHEREMRAGVDWYGFVLAGLGVVYAIAHATDVNAWWLLPAIVAVALTISLLRETRPR